MLVFASSGTKPFVAGCAGRRIATSQFSITAISIAGVTSLAREVGVVVLRLAVEDAYLKVV